MKTAALGVGLNNITNYEYWYDEDFAGRTAENVAVPASDVTVAKLLNVSLLSEGFHFLNMRFKDATGKWSCVQTDRFKRCLNYYAAPVITGDVSICAGKSIILTASSNEPTTLQYKWTGPNNYSFTGVTMTIANANTTKSGTYTCVAIKGSGICDTSITAIINVVVNPLPIVVISGLSSICNGESAYLIASGGSSYLWNNATTNDSLLITPTSTATYYVTVTSDNGCIATSSKSVSVKVAPTVVISPLSLTLCSGQSQIISASGANSYLWSNELTTASINVNPSSTTVYTVTGTATNGCSKTKSLTVNVDNAPTAIAMSNSIICRGSSITLAATGNGSQTWYVLGNTTPLTNLSVSPTNTADYIVKSENGVCPPTYDTVTITVDIPPTAIAMNNTAICEGASIGLSATGYGNQTWYVMGNATPLTNLIVSPISNTNYVVKSENGVCESAYDTVTITVNTPPTAIAMSNSIICRGSSITLAATGNGSQTWYLLGNTTPLTNLSVSPINTTDYIVKSENGVCPPTYDTVTITVDIPPTAIAMNNTAICEGASIGLSATGYGNQTWYVMGNTTPLTNLIVSPISNTNYVVKSENGVCASAYDTVLVSVDEIVESAGVISGLATVCQGQSSVNYNVPDIANATSYIWTLPNGATGISTIKDITVNYGNLAISGNITVKGNNSCGDGAISTLAITVNLLPANTGIISGLTTVCQGESFVTYNVPDIANATSYIWTLPNGASGTSTTKDITVNYGNLAISGDITVKGNNPCGDGQTAILAVTVNPIQIVTIQLAICEGDSVFINDAYRFTSGQYADTLTGITSCDSIRITDLTVNPIPATPVISQNNNSLESNAIAGNQWYNQNGLINDSTNQDYSPSQTGDYFVIVTENNCSSDTSNVIHFIYTGINSVVNENNFIIYPNPVSNQLILEYSGNTSNISFDILNALGQVVFTGNLQEKTVVQTSNFASGVYLVKLSNGNSFEFKKIIKE